MNGDGFADPAVANLRDDDVVLLAGDGIGGFTLVARIPVAADPLDIELIALEADGDPRARRREQRIRALGNRPEPNPAVAYLALSRPGPRSHLRAA